MFLGFWMSAKSTPIFSILSPKKDKFSNHINAIKQKLYYFQNMKKFLDVKYLFTFSLQNYKKFLFFHWCYIKHCIKNVLFLFCFSWKREKSTKNEKSITKWSETNDLERLYILISNSDFIENGFESTNDELFEKLLNKILYQ